MFGYLSNPMFVFVCVSFCFCFVFVLFLFVCVLFYFCFVFVYVLFLFCVFLLSSSFSFAYKVIAWPINRRHVEATAVVLASISFSLAYSGKSSSTFGAVNQFSGEGVCCCRCGDLKIFRPGMFVPPIICRKHSSPISFMPKFNVLLDGLSDNIFWAGAFRANFGVAQSRSRSWNFCMGPPDKSVPTYPLGSNIRRAVPFHKRPCITPDLASGSPQETRMAAGGSYVRYRWRRSIRL